MREFTFNVNNRGEAMEIDDIRAYALQLSSLIINASRGLPCNTNAFPALRSFYQEYNTAATVERIQDEITRAIRAAVPSVSADVSISTAEPSAASGFKPYISITITLSSTGGRAGTVVMGAAAGQGGLELKDINVFH